MRKISEISVKNWVFRLFLATKEHTKKILAYIFFFSSEISEHLLISLGNHPSWLILGADVDRRNLQGIPGVFFLLGRQSFTMPPQRTVL